MGETCLLNLESMTPTPCLTRSLSLTSKPFRARFALFASFLSAEEDKCDNELRGGLTFAASYCPVTHSELQVLLHLMFEFAPSSQREIE